MKRGLGIEVYFFFFLKNAVLEKPEWEIITSVKRDHLLAVNESSPNHCAALAACLFQNKVMFLLKIMLTKKMSRAHSLLC